MLQEAWYFLVAGTWNLWPLTLTNRISSEREDLSTGGLGMVFLASGSHPTAAARANGSHVATPAAILDQTSECGIAGEPGQEG